MGVAELVELARAVEIVVRQAELVAATTEREVEVAEPVELARVVEFEARVGVLAAAKTEMAVGVVELVEIVARVPPKVDGDEKQAEDERFQRCYHCLQLACENAQSQALLQEYYHEKGIYFLLYRK